MLEGIDTVWLILAILIIWEHIAPDKNLAEIKQRWTVNFSLLLISIIITTGLNFIFNSAPLSDDSNLLSFSAKNEFLLFLALFLLLDLFSYLLHRTLHYYHLLWRCHCAHHSDLNIDLSTNFRHHPFELIFTWGLTSLFVWLLKIDITILAAFATISLVIQMWHHSNININTTIDTYLSYLLVTPKVHKVHHSSNIGQTNSNYGTIFTVWDRIFGTFTKPSTLTEPINYGLAYFRTPSQQSFIGVLKQPFNYRQNSSKSSVIPQL